MIKAIFDLSALIAVVFVTAVALFGWGQLSWSIVGVSRPLQIKTITIWFGFCVTSGLLEIIHLFMPIDWKVTLAVGLVGLCGVVSWRHDANLGCNVNPKTVWRFCGERKWWLIFALIILVASGLRAMGNPTNTDSGLYHFQSIRWVNEYPIVLGLGNLHWRLALNQSYFAFLGLLNIAPFWGKGYAAGGLFLWLLAFGSIVEFCCHQIKSVSWIVGAILLATLSYFSPSIVNPAPDNAIVLLEIVAFLFSTQFLVEPRQEVLSPLHYRMALLLIGFTLVTIKLSSLVFALATICVLFIGYSGDLRANWRRYQRILLLLIVFVLVHLTRGYMLSGAPLFPSPLAGAWQLPWAVAKGVAQFESALIYSWARQPGSFQPSEVLASWAWFPLWLKKIPVEIVIVFSLATIFSLIAWFGFYRQRIERYQALRWLYLPVITGFVFWFFTAPDVRFLGALLPIYLSLSAWYLWQQIASVKGIKLASNAKVPVLTRLELVVCTIVALLIVLKLIGSHPALTGWSSIYQPITNSQKTRFGLMVHSPVAGDQCWDTPLPCAPSYQPDLSFEANGHLPLFKLKSD